MNGAELFASELKQRGVASVAILCGHGLDPFSAACLEAGLRLVDVRNEQSAGYMAEAVGRLTRQKQNDILQSWIAQLRENSTIIISDQFQI